MPTPFMHLHTAEQILSEMKEENGHGRILTQLEDEWSAFYLGSVAPDVNAISDISRDTTHFYSMPPAPELQAEAEMLAQFPELSHVEEISSDTAVFVSAYRAHLLLDLVWLREIVYPYFVQATHLGNREQRRLTHFILLTYLDTLALKALPETAVNTLANAHPNHWVPFIEDEILADWRDMIVAQLGPNSPVKTIEIYAGRLGMSPEEFATNLRDPNWMAEQVFGKIPVDEVQARLTEAVPSSIKIISEYLQNN